MEKLKPIDRFDFGITCMNAATVATEEANNDDYANEFFNAAINQLLNQNDQLVEAINQLIEERCHGMDKRRG